MPDEYLSQSGWKPASKCTASKADAPTTAPETFGRVDPEAVDAFAALDAQVHPGRLLAQPRLPRRHWARRLDIATARQVP